MNFRVTCELDYQLYHPVTFLFALNCLKTKGQSVIREHLLIDPSISVEELELPGGLNRFTRFRTENSGLLRVSYEADVKISVKTVPARFIRGGELVNLRAEVLPYLFPSRYCQSDRLRQMGGELFGHLTNPFSQVTAVCDWIYENISYVAGSSGENHSTIDTLDHRQGVCRDFAHLGISFCRALSLPARYTACYAHQLYPPDFHACFEVYIGSAWYLFDATRLAPLNGLIRIATGRDAADAAVCTIFGNPELVRSVVTCECTSPSFSPITHDSLTEQSAALCLP
jgi:transglutaminase-like putative cysteine protease